MELQFLTKNRDADRVILSKLNDRDLLSTCKVNSYTRKLCNDDFFKQRSLTRFPNSLMLNPSNDNWKNFYLTQIAYIEYLHKWGFNYSNESKGTAKEYYDLLKRYDNFAHGKDLDDLFDEIIKKNYIDLLFHILGPIKIRISRFLAGLRDSSKIFRATKFALKNNNNLLVYEIIKKFGILNGLLNYYLGIVINGNNKEMIDYLISLGADSVKALNYKFNF